MNRPPLPYRWMLGAAIVAWGLFAWTIFLNVPPPNPWMMGEEAFRRIMTVYAVAIVGSLVVSVLAVAVAARYRSIGLLFAALPAAAYLLVVLIRLIWGLPISQGELASKQPASFRFELIRYVSDPGVETPRCHRCSLRDRGVNRRGSVPKHPSESMSRSARGMI